MNPIPQSNEPPPEFPFQERNTEPLADNSLSAEEVLADQSVNAEERLVPRFIP
ncbi:MAG: hypothetical protein HND47_15980 [Chloroflexi bacterium]|nr:hypothetical protein [Chloroflexota bacterium]